MEIGGLQKTTFIDYPGKIACTVFLVGCNFRCPWCYSSEIVLPDKITRQPKIIERDFFSFLDERKGILEGVVICGGEPTINPELPDFIKEIKKRGLQVKLDTNGSNPEMIKSLIKDNLIDYIAMDIKAPLNEKSYNSTAGTRVDVDKVKESVKIIKNSKIDYEFRTTVVPSIHDADKIREIAQDISGAKKYFIQNFRAEKNIDESFTKLEPYSQESLEKIKDSIAHHFDVCQLRY